MDGGLRCYPNLKGEYIKVWGTCLRSCYINLKGGNLILKHVILCLLVMFVIIHDIESFSSIVMYLELNSIVESQKYFP